MRLFHTEEFYKSQGLRVLASLLMFNIVVTFFHWGDLIYVLDPAFNDGAICWHDWERCTQLRIFPASALSAIRFLSLASAFLSGFLFLSNTSLRIAATAMATALAGKMFFYLQDFQFMGNYHYIAAVITLMLLFSRHKKTAVLFTLCLTYFFTGLLKFNYEWTSGAMLTPLNDLLPGPLLPMASVFVIILEVVFVWGLLLPQKWIFWPVLLLFTLFHIFSFKVIGYYFPLLSLSLLSFFVFTRLEEHRFIFRDLKHLGGPALSILTVFASFQLIPKIQPGDSALTGEGRSLSLNVFDTSPRCLFMAILKNQNMQTHWPVDYSRWTPRTRCEPLIYFREAQRLCQENEDLTVSMISRRSTDTHFTQLFWVDNFCEKDLKLRSWGFNSWIKPTSGPSEESFARPDQLEFTNETCDLRFLNERWNCVRNQTVAWSWASPLLDAKSRAFEQNGIVRLMASDGTTFEIDPMTGVLVSYKRTQVSP